MDTKNEVKTPEEARDPGESVEERLARVSEAIEELGAQDPADSAEAAAVIADELGRLLEESDR